MAGVAVPIQIGQRFPNKPFDDFRIPAVILIVAVILLLAGVLTSLRRLWLFAGLFAGTALGLAIIGLLTLVYTFMHSL
jgi:hypothetical protein